MNFSTTQVSNIVSLVVVVFGLLKINIAEAEVQSGASALILLVSLSVNIYNRAKKGDLLLGVIKPKTSVRPPYKSNSSDC